MKNKINIVTMIIFVMLTMFFTGCSNTKNEIDFNIENANKIMVTIPNFTEKVEIIEKDVIEHLTDNINDLTFIKDTKIIVNEPIKYILTWYNESNQKIEEINIRSDNRIKYRNYYYDISIEGSKIDLDYLENYLYPFYNKPNDSQLEYWITEEVTDDTFENCIIMEKYEWYTKYYAQGYDQEDEKSIVYTVSAYPDYSGENLCITQIAVTDPSIKIIYDLTCASSLDEWREVLYALNFKEVEVTETLDEGVVYKKLFESNDRKVTITLYNKQDVFAWSIGVPIFSGDINK